MYGLGKLKMNLAFYTSFKKSGVKCLKTTKQNSNIYAGLLFSVFISFLFIIITFFLSLKSIHLSVRNHRVPGFVGRNRSSQGEPTQTWGEHKLHTKSQLAGSTCEVTVITTASPSHLTGLIFICQHIK